MLNSASPSPFPLYFVFPLAPEAITPACHHHEIALLCFFLDPLQLLAYFGSFRLRHTLLSFNVAVNTMNSQYLSMFHTTIQPVHRPFHIACPECTATWVTVECPCMEYLKYTTWAMTVQKSTTWRRQQSWSGQQSLKIGSERMKPLLDDILDDSIASVIPFKSWLEI